jgi:hypothetical protein
MRILRGRRCATGLLPEKLYLYNRNEIILDDDGKMFFFEEVQ